jgi:TonB family protein
MRGETQPTKAAWLMHMLPGLNALNFQSRVPVHERREPPPHYPDALRRAHIEGDVTLSFIVDSAGHVDRRSIQVLDTTSPGFTGAAEEALMHSQFDPAEVNGQHIAVRTSKRYAFRLNSQ